MTREAKGKITVYMFQLLELTVCPYDKKARKFSHQYFLNSFTYKNQEPELEGQFPFYHYPFYVILSAQLGGSWVGNVGPQDLPVKMEIDYVRVYERR